MKQTLAIIWPYHLSTAMAVCLTGDPWGKTCPGSLEEGVGLVPFPRWLAGGGDRCPGGGHLGVGPL